MQGTYLGPSKHKDPQIHGNFNQRLVHCQRHFMPSHCSLPYKPACREHMNASSFRLRHVKRTYLGLFGAPKTQNLLVSSRLRMGMNPMAMMMMGAAMMGQVAALQKDRTVDRDMDR